MFIRTDFCIYLLWYLFLSDYKISITNPVVQNFNQVNKYIFKKIEKIPNKKLNQIRPIFSTFFHSRRNFVIIGANWYIQS